MKELVIAAVFLGVCSVWDMKACRIPVFILFSGFLCAMIWRLLSGHWESFILTALGLGALPGILLCILSALTREKIGYGDGIMLLNIGILCGGDRGIAIFMRALFLLLPWILILSFLKKAKDREIPFAPFLFGGCIWEILTSLSRSY